VPFTGWSPEAIDFYDGLEEDNSKTYWHAHRSEYDDLVKAPLEALVAELADEFGSAIISRPNRDLRFSADRSPYKTRIYARLERGGFIQFSAAGLSAGRGLYMPAPDQLERYRGAVDDDTTGPELVALVATARRKGFEVSSRDALKTAPKGYRKDHPRIDLLRNKGLITWKEWPSGPWLSKPAAKTRVVGFLRSSGPLQDWLDTNVGPSLLPYRGRR
jgi:uncharacterized protein (TIGR02453 family)